ncbi:MAG: superfamily I DNA and RNA helicase and helicaseubunit [Crenarchaeota archaeon]|nr:superfamily I DNA and RNA helicase and helicaseubunit [Thermoproteota archaeon]
MSIIIYVPRSLYEKAREKGIDVQDLVISILREKLGLDPRDVAEAHVELAERYLEEAKQYLEKGDPVQASEKLYKVVEECIKALAESLDVPEAGKAREFGRWFAWLLDKAARRISKILNEEKIFATWTRAYDLHVWGFHEAKLDIEDVRLDLPYVEWLLEYTRKIIRNYCENV